MSLVHLDHRALSGVNGDIARVTGAVSQDVETLRSSFTQLGVSTHNLDAVLQARDTLDEIVLPALRTRQREAERISGLPYSGALTEQLAASDLRVDGEPTAEETSISAFAGGASTPSVPVLRLPEQTEVVPDEIDDPPLLSWGTLRNLASGASDRLRDGLDWLGEQISGAWDNLAESVAATWAAMAKWWDETTAQLGAWIDENLTELRAWIRDSAFILRIIAVLLKVIGWILVVVGVILLILAAFVAATGIGLPFALPALPVILGIIGAGFALVGAGDMLDTLVDWGEGKIDGQELVQGLIVEGAFTLISAMVPFGFLGKMGKKLFDLLPASWRRRMTDWWEQMLRGTPHPTPNRPPRSTDPVDVGSLPIYARPRPLDRTGRDGHLYPDDYHPYGGMDEQEFYDRYWDEQAGSWRYPPDEGFAGPRLPTTLQEGDVIDRLGPPSGDYAAPDGTPFDQRALPPSSANFQINGNLEYHRYRVVKPLPSDVVEGTAAPWFEQPGGGMQYYFPNGIQWYIDHGYLEPVP